MAAIKTAVVHIADYRKQEYLDRHAPHKESTGKRRPFLLLLSPDTLQLVTASDASDGPSAAASLVIQASTRDRPSSRPASPAGSATSTPRQPTAKPLSLLHKLTHSQAAGSGAAAAAAAAEEASQPEGQELGEVLEEGQMLTFAIALSQVAGIERDERRIKIYFSRQKPHRSTTSNDDWKSVMKSVFFPLVFPIEATKHKNWGVNQFMSRHKRDPFVGSVVIEADSPQEAATLHRSIEDAIARMAQAVRWLTQELPLNSTPVVTLVTAVGPGGAAASGDLPFPGGPATAAAAAVGGPESVAGAAPGAAERIVCAFPRFKQPLDIPIAAEDGPLLGGGDGGGGKGEEAAGGGGDKGGSGGGGGDDSAVAVNVWLHSPLGPAVAGITTTQLRRSADAGGAPVTLTATPREAEEARAQASRSKLEVQVQFTATWLPPPAAPQRRRLSSMLSPANAAGSSGSVVGGGTNNGSSGLIAMLAVLCVPLLAGWLDLPAAAAGSPAVQVLQSVAFLVSSIAAVVAIVVLQLKSWARQAPLPQAEAAAPPPPAGCWRLTLLHADLVQESRHTGGAPTVRRVVSSSTLTPSPSTAAALLPLLDATSGGGGAVELPHAIQQLVAAKPAILTEDIAARFLVGLGSSDKAYQALRSMVDWVEAQGVAELVRSPQPRFEIIKAHYPQVFYAWSSTSDCVLEVERTGQWRAAFEALRAQGVTEQELLHHQFFSMEYAFRVLDTRPLPQGKTVKIIDLEGLTMRDVSSAAFKWYLQVGGALLAVNYPQRLQKAFLLNAPAWSGVIWKVLAAIIPRKTREQLQLFTTKQRAEAGAALLQWVPAEQLPVQYGGTCTVPLGQSQLEKDMLAYVRGLNKGQEAAGAPAGAPAAGDQAA